MHQWWSAAIVLASLGCSFSAVAFDVPSLAASRRDDDSAHVLEAAYVVQRLAGTIAACVDRDRSPGAPPPALPSNEAAAFACADFAPTPEQRYRYRWTRFPTPPSPWYAYQGEVRAEADFDGDGRVDHALSMAVACTTKLCTTAPKVKVEDWR
jgi:hypothetical protein